MAEELTLTLTTEDSLQGRGAPSRLWMWVDPSLACPIPGSPDAALAGFDSHVASVAGATETLSLNTSWDHPDPHCSEEDVLSPSSEAGKLTKNEDASRVDIPVPQEMLETHELKAMPKPWKSVVLRPQRVKLKCPRQMSIRIKGVWLRPLLNYCVLIALALRNSVSGSLTAQQIYQFTRQHFPFFQVASKGWKNTIRHNLCFSSCFEKTAGLVCGEGKRKSCLWELTPEGRRKFQEEVEALPKEALDMVRQSMSKPSTFSEGRSPAKRRVSQTLPDSCSRGTQARPVCGHQHCRTPGPDDPRHVEIPAEAPPQAGLGRQTSQEPFFNEPDLARYSSQATLKHSLSQYCVAGRYDTYRLHTDKDCGCSTNA